MSRKIYNVSNWIGYSAQTPCKDVHPVMVDNCASLFNCTTVGRSSDWRTASFSFCFRLLAPDYQCLWSRLLWSCLWFSCDLAADHIEPFCFVSIQCIYITKTCLYNFDPLKSHFYIVKLGFTGVYIIFLISAQNIDCGYSLEPPRRGGSNEYPQSMFWAEIWKKSNFFYLKIFIFWW